FQAQKGPFQPRCLNLAFDVMMKSRNIVRLLYGLIIYRPQRLEDDPANSGLPGSLEESRCKARHYRQQKHGRNPFESLRQTLHVCELSGDNLSSGWKRGLFWVAGERSRPTGGGDQLLDDRSAYRSGSGSDEDQILLF